MARVNTYLNFPRNIEEVFTFYKSVFGGELGGAGGSQQQAGGIWQSAIGVWQVAE
jgi:hypothetical protein